MIKYITRRPLWFNILAAAGIVAAIFLIFMFSLKWITRHGDSKTVPAVVGKKIEAVQQQLSDGGFDLVIQDSVYYDSVPPGIVVYQFPDPDQVVKVNRTVYVKINRFVPPDIPMPNLVGYSLRNAELTLESLGLKLGDTSYTPDFAKNSVKDMKFGGEPIKPGDKIKVGSRIDLVLSSGLGNEDMAVPKLIGLTLGEAKILLEQYGLMLGVVIPENMAQNDNVFIREQRPMPKTPDGLTLRIRTGQMIDLFVQTEPVVIDSLNPNLPPPPQTPQLP